MSTTVRVRLVRQLVPESFTDITPAAFEVLGDDEHPYVQVVFDAVLTEPQKAAVVNRCESVNANGEELYRRARAALAANRNYLALPTKTQADVLAQVEALTRQMNGVIRFVLHAYDGTE